MILTILNSMLPAAAVALAAWIAMRLLRVNAATRCWVWWSVLAAVVLPFVLPAAAPLEVPEAAAVTLPAESVRVNWLVWTILVWTAYRSTRIVWSFVRLMLLKRRATAAPGALAERLEHWRTTCPVRRGARVLISGRIAMPMAVGFLRPAVVLPEAMLRELTPEEMDHVLLHELAHIARRDDWTNLEARLIGIVFGLHPVAAFALSQIDREREMACDDWVVAATGEPRIYAASLTRVFELSQGERQPLLASGAMGSKLGNRVEQILTNGQRVTRGASLMSYLVIAVALGGILHLGARAPGWIAFAQTPAATPAPPPPVTVPETPVPTPAPVPTPNTAPAPEPQPEAPAPPPGWRKVVIVREPSLGINDLQGPVPEQFRFRFTLGRTF